MMKLFREKIWYFLLGGLLMTAGTAYAVQVSVPSAPGNGYMLISTSTGNYIATTTDPIHAGSFFATSTNPNFFPFASTSAISISNTPLATSTVVCKQSGNCEFTTIQGALTAGRTNIFVRNGVYSEQLTIQSDRTIITGESQGAIIQCAFGSQSPCVTTNAKNQVVIRDIAIRETNAALGGIGLDISDSALTRISNVRITNFATSTYIHDSTNNTFYNQIENSTFFNPKTCFDFGGTQANNNLTKANRCRPSQAPTAGGFGLYLSDIRGYTSVGDDFEGTSTSNGVTGIFIDATSREINITNPWIEAQQNGVTIASGANRVTFNGGSITSNGTDVTDNGTNSIFVNTSITGVLRNRYGSATTTNLAITNITSCSGTSALTTTAAGDVACGAISGSGGAAFEWTPTINYGVNTSATTTPVWMRGAVGGIYSLMASGTSAFDQIVIGSSTAGTMSTSTFFGNIAIRGAASTTAVNINSPGAGNKQLITLTNNNWGNGQYLQQTWQDGTGITGAIGMNFNSTGSTIDFAVTSLYNNGYTDTTYIPFIVKGSGNVGVGSSTPAERLSVQGNILSSGTTTAGTLVATSSVMLPYLGGSGNRFVTITNTGLVSSIALPLTYANGGTGTTTGVQGQLAYYGSNSYQAVGTTTVSCAGTASCSPFVVLNTAANPGPFTITGSGSGSGSFPFSADTNFGAVVYSTTTPTIFLKAGVQASSTSHFVSLDTASSTGPGVLFTDPNGTVSFGERVAGGNYYLSTSTGYNSATTTNSTVFVVSQSGSASVGIGSLATTTQGAFTIRDQNGTGPILEMGGNAGGDTDWIIRRYSNNNSTNDDRLAFINAPTEVFSILPTGFVAVGSTTPWGQFSINPTSANNAAPSFAIGSTTGTVFAVNNAGRTLIGTSTIAVANPAMVTIDSGNSTSEEAIMAVGNVNDFYESNIKNRNNGTAAQACQTATSDTGTLTTGFISICANSSTFWNPQTYNVGGPGDSSIMGLSTGDLFIAQATLGRNTYFVNGGTSTSTNLAMTISSLNVGIGTSTPKWTATLSSSTRPQLALDDALGSNPWTFRSIAGNLFIGTSSPTTYATSSGQSAIQIGPSATGTMLGVATTTPWRTLSVAGGAAISGLSFSTAGNAVCILTNFEIVQAGNNACSTSSRKTKHNIEDLSTSDALAEVMALNPVSFTYNESGDNRIGFIAEEVNRIDPRLVDLAQTDVTFPKSSGTIKKGDPISVEYGNITALLVKVAQNQQEQINAIKAGTRTVEENWQWGAIILLVLWNVALTLKKKH